MKIVTRVFASAILLFYLVLGAAGTLCISHYSNLQTIDESVSSNSNEIVEMTTTVSDSEKAEEVTAQQITLSEKIVVEKPSVEEAVKNVIDGKYGNGEERKNALTALGFTEAELSDIQNKVDTALKSSATIASSSKSVTVTANPIQYSKMETAAIVWNRLRQAGYSKEICAGILGNIQQECDFNYQSDGSGCWGLCQWTDGRLRNLRTNYGTDLNSQITFLLEELKSYQDILHCTSVYSAAEFFCNRFERPRVKVTSPSNKRVIYAENWYVTAQNSPDMFS